MDATKPCLLFYKKRKKNKDLPSLKSRNTESKEEMYKSRREILFFKKINYLKPIHRLLSINLLLDYKSNIYLGTTIV